MAEVKHSEQQISIFNWFKDGEGNLVIRARAGTGKTYTVVNAIQFAPEQKILMAAFNKRIATELKEKIKNPKAEAKTLHSVGCGFVYRNWEGAQLSDERGERLARRSLPAGAPDAVVRLTARLAAIGKNAFPFPKPGDLADAAYQYDLDPDEYLEEQGWTVDRIAIAAEKAMEFACQKDGTFDFDDMVFVPVRNGWVRPKYDLVVIDEAQDMNASQLMLAMKVCKRGGRIAVVGDDRQAIYGFRGADSNSIDRLKGELVAHELGLTITYRCPQKVVAMAKSIVPDYQAAPTAPEGVVREASYETMVAEAGPGDFVLSRKNAPLMKVCLKFIAQGRRAMIEGREIGTGLVNVIKAVKGKSMPDFLERLTKWEDKQKTRLMKTGKKAAEKKAEYIADQAECLRAVAQAPDVKSIEAMKTKIMDMFGETAGGKHDYIVCSSVHKAKGLERKRVWGLVETLYPGGRRSVIEEQNIEYVMITRAMNEFVSVVGIS
jgi:superfamily I DNA/RNA helicase